MTGKPFVRSGYTTSATPFLLTWANPVVTLGHWLRSPVTLRLQYRADTFTLEKMQS
jgi:hypothetical protein